MTRTPEKAPTYSFHKELFNWDGMYLTYGNNSSDTVFIARFKYGKKPYKRWINFLFKNFTVQEYLNAATETSPLKAIEDKGYVDQDTIGRMKLQIKTLKEVNQVLTQRLEEATK